LRSGSLKFRNIQFSIEAPPDLTQRKIDWYRGGDMENAITGHAILLGIIPYSHQDLEKRVLLPAERRRIHQFLMPNSVNRPHMELDLMAIDAPPRAVPCRLVEYHHIVKSIELAAEAVAHPLNEVRFRE
jgi:hypothetical protein